MLQKFKRNTPTFCRIKVLCAPVNFLVSLWGLQSMCLSRVNGKSQWGALATAREADPIPAVRADST